MKKAIALILLLSLMLALSGCGGSDHDSSAGTSTAVSATEPTETPAPTPANLSDSEVRSRAATALYKQLLKNQASKYDIDQTTCSIGSVTKEDLTTWVVKGSFSLYDDYGRYKKSGTFSAYVHSYGSDYCLINLN